MSNDAARGWDLIGLALQQANTPIPVERVFTAFLELIKSELSLIENKLTAMAHNPMASANRGIEKAALFKAGGIRMRREIEQARLEYTQAADCLSGLHKVKALLAACLCSIAIKDNVSLEACTGQARSLLQDQHKQLSSGKAVKSAAASVGGVAAFGGTLWGIAAVVAATGIGLVPVGLVGLAAVAAGGGVAAKINAQKPELIETEVLGNMVFGNKVFG